MECVDEIEYIFFHSHFTNSVTFLSHYDKEEVAISSTMNGRCKM